MFSLQGVSVSIGQRELLSNIDLYIEPQTITAIMGANGAGKSTLFKCLLGEFPVTSGQVTFKQQNISEYSQSELSRYRAYIAQAKPKMFNMLVLEYLLLARIQYIESTKYSENLVLEIAKQFNIMGFLMRDITTLSGGESQIIEFVRAYLQLYETNNMQGKCLLLDEPASALDIKQTRLLYQHLQAFAQQGGTVIIIDHDINQAASLANNLVLIQAGKVLANGGTHTVFTQHNLDACFATNGQMIQSASHKANFYHLSFQGQPNNNQAIA